MNKVEVPDSTAVRVALWRALHVQIDSKPYVFEDEIGLRLVAPDENWKNRPDMHPMGTKSYRASIVGRARLIEDLLIEKIGHGVGQYIILGAGLDTFVQRRPEVALKIKTFEIDKPATQEWKKQRLVELDFGIPEYLRFVPVDFEAGESWWEKLKLNGFNEKQISFLSSTGVAMYLTKEAVMEKLKRIATLAKGSTLAMSYMLPLELIDEAERAQLLAVQERAKAAGTPFRSFFRPDEIIEMAHLAGFSKAESLSTSELKYFDGRSDGLRPSSGESILIATI